MRLRTYLLVGAGTVGAAALAACGSTSSSDSVGTASPSNRVPAATANGSDLKFDGGVAPTPAQIREAFKNVKSPSGEIPVVWRIDDIQAWFCSSILDSVFEPFTSTNTPLSIGIIGTGLSGDPTVNSVLKSLENNPNIEFANHSFTHPSGGLPSLGGLVQQQADLQQDQDMIKSVVNVSADTFIPPDNVYDDNTVQAMKNVNLTNMSAQCTWTAPGVTALCPEGSDVTWPNLTWSNLISMPAGAVIDDWSDFSKPASVDIAMAWADAQIKNQGFAVFMLHPQELATDGTGQCKTVDQSKLGVIKDVISQGAQKGWRYYTFDGMAQAAKDVAAKAPKAKSGNR